MKLIAIVMAAGVIAAPHGALAQAANPPTDPVKLGLARDIVEASGGQKAAEARITTLFSTIGKGMAAQMPSDQGRLAEAFQDDLSKEMTSMVPQIMDISVHAYADVFTEKELRDWLAFQESASGQAITRKSPLVMQQAMTQMMPLIFKMMPSLMQRTADRVCQENHCTPAQQQIVADAVRKAMSGKQS